MVLSRVAKKDPDAINFLGEQYWQGGLGLIKNTRKAVKLWEEAAELGSIEAIHALGGLYYRGLGVQKDKAKGIHLYEKAAMQGYVESRHNLGKIEGLRRNNNRAVRHFLISANMGYMDSLENIKKMFTSGFATKEQYVEALKGHQAAKEEMKSHDRDEAKRRDET